MEKELRIFKKDGLWHSELWLEFDEPFHSGKQFEDKVTGASFPNLIIGIGNKNWIDLLNK